jgi:Arc/MetJ-type ribon-helix-helix transcriptional regulator
MNKTKRLDGGKKLISLTGEMEKDIRAFCRQKNIESESELIRQAIARFIYPDYSDETMKLQGITALREKITELRDMIDILFKYVRLAHINLLAYNAELDTEFADAAFRSATARHEKFFNAFQESLKNDPPFFERLLHKYFIGESDGQG